MVTCPNCNLTDIRIANGNFASVKLEGQPSAKYTYDKKLFHCRDCEKNWESTPEVEKDYNEYIRLSNLTTISVQDFKDDGSYEQPQYIDDDETLRTELAKKIVSSYKHILNLNPEEWLKIEKDASQTS
jgi:hypothetical protein